MHETLSNPFVNSRSVLTKKDDQQIWNCEFCATENTLCLEDEEKPTEETNDYVLEAPKEAAEATEENEDLIIFCIDISGVPLFYFKQSRFLTPLCRIHVCYNGSTWQTCAERRFNEATGCTAQIVWGRGSVLSRTRPKRYIC